MCAAEALLAAIVCLRLITDCKLAATRAAFLAVTLGLKQAMPWRLCVVHLCHKIPQGHDHLLEADLRLHEGQGMETHLLRAEFHSL